MYDFSNTVAKSKTETSKSISCLWTPTLQMLQGSVSLQIKIESLAVWLSKNTLLGLNEIVCLLEICNTRVCPSGPCPLCSPGCTIALPQSVSCKSARLMALHKSKSGPNSLTGCKGLYRMPEGLKNAAAIGQGPGAVVVHLSLHPTGWKQKERQRVVGPGWITFWLLRSFARLAWHDPCCPAAAAVEQMGRRFVPFWAGACLGTLHNSRDTIIQRKHRSASSTLLARAVSQAQLGELMFWSWSHHGIAPFWFHCEQGG